MNIDKRLMYFHIVAFLSLPLLFLFGTMIDFVFSGIFYFSVACLGQAVLYHRCITHKTFEPPRWFFIFGNIVCTLSGLGSGIAWAANHLQHHRFSDTDKDPHSPYYESKLKIYATSMATEVNMKYVGHHLKDKTLVWFHENFWKIHGVYIALLLGFYPFGLISMYLAPAAIVWMVTCAFNIYCHIYGYRNFETRDKSTNNFLLAIFAFGEGWHNNHHKYPGSYTTKVKWWELDISGLVIKLIGKNLKSQEGNK